MTCAAPDLPSALDIQAALAAAGLTAPGADAVRLADEVRRRGGLDQAAAVLAADERFELLSLLLAYRSALQDASDPALRIRRLRLRAKDLDARAEPLWREAAEDAGLAAARRLRGEHALAETFAGRSVAAEQLAAELEAQAFALRLEAAQLEAERARRRDLMTALQGVAA